MSRLFCDIFVLPKHFIVFFELFAILNPNCECSVKDSIFRAANPINAPFFNVFDSLMDLKYGSKILVKACDLPVPGLPNIPIKFPLVSGLTSF